MTQLTKISSKQKKNSDDTEETSRDLGINPRGHSEEASQETLTWTIVHSFHAVMGGFAFETSKVLAEDKFLPGSEDRVAPSPEAVLFLAEHEPDLLPKLSKADILDKSKADYLTKGLVCLQATWFVAQCITRLAQGLSLSLLEINTLAHTACTLIIYALWWNKPLNIAPPTLISGTQMHSVCAYLCFLSQFDNRRDASDLSLFEKRNQAPSKRPLPGSCVSRRSLADDVENTPCLEPQLNPANSGEQQLHMIPNVIRADYPNFRADASGSFLKNCAIEPSRSDHRRWVLACQYRLYTSSTLANKDSEITKVVRERMRNWPEGFEFLNMTRDIIGQPYAEETRPSLPSYKTVLFAVAFTVAGLTYGGLHLLAWNAPFTSAAQLHLWRTSGILMAASGPVAFLLWLGFNGVRMLMHFLQKGSPKSQSDAFALFLLPLLAIVVLCILYLSARVYLVVECYISLAYLPESITKHPNWSLYFPHVV